MIQLQKVRLDFFLTEGDRDTGGCHGRRGTVRQDAEQQKRSDPYLLCRSITCIADYGFVYPRTGAGLKATEGVSHA